jgi:hypothetical protein
MSGRRPTGLPDPVPHDADGYRGVVPTELIHRRTRIAFREQLARFVLRRISDLFDGEGISCSPVEPDLGGQRRCLVERYYATVDWADPSDVGKVLRVYEVVLAPTREIDGSGDVIEVYLAGWQELVDLLKRDGYTLDRQGRLRVSKESLATMPVHMLSDASSIHEHMDRISGCMDTDPQQAVSGAKSLIEATTKLVLNELAQVYDEQANVPALVKRVQIALKLHPDTLAPTARGTDTVKRILSNLSQVAVGVAELRNEYGPDHGRTVAVPLGPRHAHLAVGCASAYCRMLLETLEARLQAPAGRS